MDERAGHVGPLDGEVVGAGTEHDQVGPHPRPQFAPVGDPVEPGRIRGRHADRLGQRAAGHLPDLRHAARQRQGRPGEHALGRVADAAVGSEADRVAEIVDVVDPSPVSVPVLMRELGNKSLRGVS